MISITQASSEVENDTILYDLVISLPIAIQGHPTQYDFEVYACDTSSADVKKELKRKVRIAALAPLLNIFKYEILSFQNISHRVLRWTLAPLSLLLLILSNALLLFYVEEFSRHFLAFTFWLQVCFYIMALFAWFFENRHIKLRYCLPFYFFIMNLAVCLGFFSLYQKEAGCEMGASET